MKDNMVESYDNWQYDSCLIINKDAVQKFQRIADSVNLTQNLEANGLTNKMTPESFESSKDITLNF